MLEGLHTEYSAKIVEMDISVFLVVCTTAVGAGMRRVYSGRWRGGSKYILSQPAIDEVLH